MSDIPQIVFLDRGTLGPEVVLRRPSFDHRWEAHEASAAGEIVDRAEKAQIIILNKVKITADVLDHLPELRLVAVAATGTDVVELQACKARGVAVCNVRNYAATSVPEHILALMFALRRQLPAYQRRVSQGDWQRSGQFCFFDQPVVDLAGSTLGIVGTGSIATALGALAEAVGIRVLFHSLSGRQMDDRKLTSLEELLEISDVVSLNCPLNPASEKIIGEDTIQRMKPEALLINTARGAMVDMHALENALLTQQIGGAGIDVCDEEPPSQDDPVMRLCHLDNVIVTPHSAWSSRAAMQHLADQLIDVIDAFVAGKPMNRLT